MAWQLSAPAKINLTLEVLARRDDGYHGVRSLMVPLALADTLAIEPAPAFEFTCSLGELGGDDNLVVRAARALGEPPPVRIALEKRVPTQAGLGGGSSDAAAVLRAMIAGLFGERYRRADWPAVARALGSDVPFFLAGTAALVEGTGERVTPAGALPPWHVLAIKPPVAVSTAAAYAELDRHPRPTRARSGSVSIGALEALQRGQFHLVEALLHNDFHEVVAAAHPPVARAIAALRAAGASNALLSGSGSCVFSMAENADDIARIERALDLPAEYLRFPTSFAASPEWRG